jgi:flagellar hook-length control protein FliK
MVGGPQGRDGGSSPITSADQNRFLQRVARAFAAVQQRGGGPLRLRLSPPELGSLRVEIRVEGGLLSARLEAETAMARALLLDNVTTLQERLADQGIRVQQFDVDLMDRQPGGGPAGGAADEGDPGRHRSQTTPHAEEETSSTTPREGDSPDLREGEDGHLNVII